MAESVAYSYNGPMTCYGSMGHPGTVSSSTTLGEALSNLGEKAKGAGCTDNSLVFIEATKKRLASDHWRYKAVADLFEVENGLKPASMTFIPDPQYTSELVIGGTQVGSHVLHTLKVRFSDRVSRSLTAH